MSNQRYKNWMNIIKGICFVALFVFFLNTGENVTCAKAALERSIIVTKESSSFDSISFSWTQLEGAAGYFIKQSTDKTALKKTYGGVGYLSNFYISYGMDTGVKQYYRVYAVDANGKSIACSKLFTMKPKMPVPLMNEPANLGNGQMVLSWAPSVGAETYQIRRSTTEKGGYKKIDTTTTNSYIIPIDTETTYYYRIRPYRHNGDGSLVEGTGSVPLCIQSQKGEKPVIDEVAATSEYALTVKWQAIPGKAAYTIWRCAEENGNYESIGTMSGQGTLIYTDVTIAPGKQYYYKVSSYEIINGAIVQGAMSDAKSIWTAPKAPSDLTAFNQSSGGVLLSWSATPQSTSYNLYRSDSLDGIYSELAKGIQTTTYTDKQVEAGKTYYYKIQAAHDTIVGELSAAKEHKVGQIILNTNTLILGPGVTATITAYSPDLQGTPVFTSSDTAVAVVDATGLVVGIGYGTATITVDISGVKTAVKVSVTDVPVNGIDVSKWQGNINWDKVKASGVQFVMLRAAFHTATDVKFDEYYANASALGFPIGVYCYSTALTKDEAKAEVKNLIKVLNNRNLVYPVVLDFEYEAQLKLTTEERMEIISVFKKQIEKAGYRFALYANLNWLTTYVDDSQLAGVDIWLARYRAQNLGTGYTGSGNVTMWQYSDKGNIDGILDAAGKYIDVDMNVCYQPYTQACPYFATDSVETVEDITEPEI